MNICFFMEKKYQITFFVQERLNFDSNLCCEREDRGMSWEYSAVRKHKF